MGYERTAAGAVVLSYPTCQTMCQVRHGLPGILPRELCDQGAVVRDHCASGAMGHHATPVPTFRDVPPEDAFYGYIETAYSSGIISGYNCGAGCLEFRPGNNATRGQICKMVYYA